MCGWDDCEQVQVSLEALLDTSLLTQRERAEREVRLTMLETVREYALEQMAAHGELEHLQQRHAVYFATVGNALSRS